MSIKWVTWIDKKKTNLTFEHGFETHSDKKDRQMKPEFKDDSKFYDTISFDYMQASVSFQ